MDSAEWLMNDSPKHARLLIDSIDSKYIDRRSLNARYALLKTEADYKNYINETNDSLIMIAVRYYSGKRDVLSRFQSYYYLGCIYYNANNYPESTIALSEAERLADYVGDDYKLGLLYSQLGDLFLKSFDYNRAEQYFRKATDCYARSGKEKHHIYGQYDIAACLMDLHLFNSADSIFLSVQRWAIDNKDSQLYANTLLSRLSCYLYTNDTDSAKNIIQRYQSAFEEKESSFRLLESTAHYYIIIKDIPNASSYLKKAWAQTNSRSDSITMYYLNTKFANVLNHTEEALDFQKQYISLQNEELKTALRQPILGVQKDHFKTLTELEILKNKHGRVIMTLGAIIFLLIMSIAYFFYLFQKKRMEEQILDSLSVVKELTIVNHTNTRKIESLKSELLNQIHERHDVSNRLYSMYFDSKSHEKIAKQQLATIINNLRKEYTTKKYTDSLDKILNELYCGIMKQLSLPEIQLTDKEQHLIRLSLAGFSLKSVSVILNESAQNLYQIKSRLMKKIQSASPDLWNDLNNVL